MTNDGSARGEPAATAVAGPLSLTAEHSWEAAASILYPLLRSAGARGVHVATLSTPAGAAGNVETLFDDGPAGLLVAYALAAGGYDVLANGDHLAAWCVSAAILRDTAFRNLDAWSATAPWSVDASDGRRVISSDTGDGWDASRILLPDVLAHLERELGGTGDRVLVGIPARHLLVAGALHVADPEFAPLFAEFVLDYAADSDESIDGRLFELRDGRLVLFEPTDLA